MSEFRLDTYLRMHRRRLALGQAEVAVLLGIESASEVSRHEQGRRVPSLDTALAYEAILGAPVAELFSGRFERSSRRISHRARHFLEQHGDHPSIEAFRRLIDITHDNRSSNPNPLH
jgi:transcriptional regulator with XRE-family HTH domain